ncbi:MAG: PQQ-binding-like beta-propeller repeat protein [Acidobacteria bacterium]|nr:PQQ-binding-like beta-propeller repeat protein [Acidobacteriota bacterium]
MRYPTMLAVACLCLLESAANAQGINGRPLPFEPGYFPGFEQPRVVATTAHMEVTTDDRALVSSYPVDAQLVRVVMVKNISTTRIRVPFTPGITITPFQPNGFICHPQPGVLYLDPGQSHPVRLAYEIPTDNTAPAWSRGDRVSVPMTLALQEQSVTSGQDVGAPVIITLPNIVSVDRDPHASAFEPDPPANAVITGTVRHADTMEVYANVSLMVNSEGVGQRVPTDASGRYTAYVFAYRRSGGTPDWREFGLRLDSPSHALDPQSIVMPRAGETTTLDVLVPEPRTAINYAVTSSLYIDLTAYAWDGSADGSVMATVPFHTDLPWNIKSPRAFVNVFTSTGTLLWRFPIQDETPAIDVSDDGQFVATCRLPANEPTPGMIIGGSAILLNRAGQLLLEVPVARVPLAVWGPESRDSRFTEVRLSHDNRYLAIGDNTGWLFLLDRATGRELWRVFTRGQVRRIDFDTNDARMFVGSGDGYLRAFDLRGNQLWQSWVDSWLTAIDISAHYLVTSSKAARQGMHLVNKVTGAQVWSYPVETIAHHVKIAPDESYVWYGTSIGGGYWLLNNALFTMDGLPRRQLASANLGSAAAGAISADSQLVAWSRGCTVNVSDREGRPVFRSAQLGTTADADCGMLNHMLWMSPDGTRIVAAVGPRNTASTGATVYFLGTGGTTSAPDCFFNWAERNYPTWFLPAGRPSVTQSPYYYRYYPGTNAYLATSSADSHVYYLGPQSGQSLLDAGPLSTWLTTAGCQ